MQSQHRPVVRPRGAITATSRLARRTRQGGHGVELLESRTLLHGGHVHDAPPAPAPVPATPPAEHHCPADTTTKTAAAARPTLTAGPGPAAPAADTLAPRGVTGTNLLPDLVVLADQQRGYLHDYHIDRSEIPGRNLLRFSTAVGNGGAGPLELFGNGSDANVFQRIYNSGGGTTSRLAGQFEFHPQHGHIHFDDFAIYRLRRITANNGVGEVVATGDKVSFCLIDIGHFGPNLPNSPSSGRYGGCGLTQGISVGWNDVYGSGLPDQWIDVTGVADGRYWLEVVTDHNNRILETNENNNATRIQIDLQTQVVPLAPDRFEANNSFAAATNFGTLGRRAETGLSIHASGNDDYYRFTAGATGQATLDLLFNHSQGDVDVEVFNANFSEIGSANGTSNTEHVGFGVQAGQTYYVRVFGYSGATNPRYDMTINTPASVNIVATDAVAAEPGSNTGLFTITRNGSPNTAVTVNYAVSGTAANGTDYQRLSGSVVLSVLVGQSATIPIRVIDDAVREGAETVTVRLLPGTGYTVGAGASATVTIQDNDTVVVNPDPRDQFSEAFPISMGGTSGLRTLTTTTSVQMYRITALAGQRMGFDIDPGGTLRLDSYIRLFNASGLQLAANDNRAAPGEALGIGSYLEYTFTRTGTYYLSVSGRGNTTYNPITGTGDRVGARGSYTLFLTNRPTTTTAAALSASARVAAAPLMKDRVADSVLDADDESVLA